MVDHAKNTITPQEMESRYQRAQSLMQGMFTKTSAFNTTVIPHWIGDSDCFWYEREFKIGKEFRLVDAAAGSNEIAFDHAALAKALAQASGEAVNAEDLPIRKMDLSLSPLQLSFDAYGKRFLFSSEGNGCTEIEAYPDNWTVSPDGSKVAFVRDDNLWIQDINTGEERALTQDGETFYCYGSESSAWGVKLPGDSLEALWSPDSKRLFTLQMDTRQVNVGPMMEYAPQDGDVRPRILAAERRMALPGDKHIDEYRFLSIEVETGQQQDAYYRRCPVFRNAEGFFSGHRGWWSNDSRHAYFIDIERGGDHVARLVEFDTHTGHTRTVIEEESPDTCFKLRLDSRLPIHTKPLPNSDDVLWYSERSGWGHLYLYDIKTGELKHPITKGEWIVREIHHYDAERRELIIQTAGRIAGRDPYYCDICRVNIDTGEIAPIISTDQEYLVFDQGTEMASNYAVTRDISGGMGVSPTGNYVVTTRSRVDEAPVSILLDQDGNERLILETADVSGLPDGWQWPERVKLLAADGKTDIYGVVYRPSCFSPDQSYPIIDNTMMFKESFYSSIGSFSNNPLADFRYLEPAAIAELGFIVVDIMARGTANRDRVFSASPDVELPSSENQADRIAGIRQLAERYPYMDLSRVGAGGSVSSNVAASGLLGNPEFYTVGVSNAPVMEPGLSPAFAGEAYNDLPAMADTHQLTHTYAKNLKGKLLLMHGMINPAISVAHTFLLVEALQAANKDFDMLVLPNDGYPVCSYGIRRGWDYFVKHLLGVEPPLEFELITSMDIFIGDITGAGLADVAS